MTGLAGYPAAGIDTVKREHPGATLEFAVVSVNPRNTGGVGGYHLIDERADLPGYSERRDPVQSAAAKRSTALMAPTTRMRSPYIRTVSGVA